MTPELNNAIERARRTEAEFERAYHNRETPRARRNHALLATFVVIGGGVGLVMLLASLWLKFGMLGAGIWFLFVLALAWKATRKG